MQELIVIRHGQSLYNVQLTTNLDSELSDEGIRQVRATGKYLREQFPHIAYFVGETSPYLRCLMTAKILQEETGVEFWVKTGPREVMMTYPDVHIISREKEFPGFVWKYPKDGITFKTENEEEFTERTKRYSKEISLLEKALIVSHGTTATSLIQMALGKYERPPIQNGTFVDNSSISCVREGKSVLYNHKAY